MALTRYAIEALNERLYSSEIPDVCHSEPGHEGLHLTAEAVSDVFHTSPWSGPVNERCLATQCMGSRCHLSSAKLRLIRIRSKAQGIN